MAEEDPVVKLVGEIATLEVESETLYQTMEANREQLVRKKKLKEALELAMDNIDTWRDLKATVLLYDDQVEAKFAV